MDYVNGQIKDVVDATDSHDASTYEQSNSINVDGVMKYQGAPFMKTVSINSGTGTIYVTSDGTSGGTALFSEIIHTSITANDHTAIFSIDHSWSDIKTLVINIAKQNFTGITVLGIPVLGSVTLPAAPNGTSVTILIRGVKP